jgi:DNA-binding transcriptional MerR regulator
MFSIGDFARHGRVSIRMLRHYDAIGLLRPAHVDESSGYRFYEAAQLSELNRVVALRGLGFRLDQVQTMLDEHIGVERLRGMLRLRQAELEAGLAAGVEQLTRVETRLRTIESEGQMPSEEVVVKRIDAMRVAELTDVATTFTPEDIGPVIRPLCARLGEQLAAGTVEPTGRLITYYEQRPGEDDEVVIHAAVPINAVSTDCAPVQSNGLSIVDLEAVEQAATIVHRGTMDAVESSVDTLARWIDHHGYRAVGFPRELYLEVPEDESKWITELQQPIVVA